MAATESIGDMNQIQVANQHSSLKNEMKFQLNGDANSFVPTECGDGARQTFGTFTLKVSLDSKIWRAISANSSHNRLNGLKRFSSKHVAAPIPEPYISRAFRTEVTPRGLICIKLIDGISIDISIDKAIKITCPMQEITVSVSPTATNSVIFHPNGRILQNFSRVDLVAFDGAHQNRLMRFAKVWRRGISFMAKDVPVVYLVDEAGLRSSTDQFMNIEREIVYDVFNNGMGRNTLSSFNKAVDILQKSIYKHDLSGSDMIEINEIRIISYQDGIERLNDLCSIRINLRKQGITFVSPYIHATASMGKSPHIFLRQGERRIHFDGAVFCVRNGGYSAGFDEKNQVTIFNKSFCSSNV